MDIFITRIHLWIWFVSAAALGACQPSAPPPAPPNALLQGTVVDLRTQKPLEGVAVSLFYHDLQWVQEGLWIGEPLCEIPERTVFTDAEGTFELPARADTTGLPTYAWLTCEQEGYERMHEVLVDVQAAAVPVGTISLRTPGSFTTQSTGSGKYAHDQRPEQVFAASPGAEACFTPGMQQQLISIRELMPSGGYARLARLKRGYNRWDGRKQHAWNPSTTVLFPLELTLAGVVEGEVGLFTDHPEALKTQAIWARTYALDKARKTRQPQNFQMAFRTTISEASLAACRQTKDLILTHTAASGGYGQPIQAVFSARCNGDYTQPGAYAKWQQCKMGGNYVPYLLSVACSQHPNCFQAGMSEGSCCNVNPRLQRYIFGHGAGGCQHGMRDFAEKDWSYQDIAPYFFQGSALVHYRQDVWTPPGLSHLATQ